jgi:hypothetical protein
MRAAFRMLWVGLKARMRLVSVWSWIFMAIGAILVPPISYWLGRVVGSASETISPEYLLPFLTGALNVILFMQIGASFSSAFYHLYLSRDLPLLLASPSRPRSVILAKMLEVAGSGLVTYVFAGIPLLVALGVAWYAPPWYYVLAVLAGLPFAVLPAVLAVLTNLLVIRILPPYRSKEITAALGTIAGAITYLLFHVASSSELWRQARDAGPSAFSRFFGRLGPSWSPSTLLARAVVEGLYERWAPLLVSGVLLTGAVLALFAFVATRTERAYLTGWAASREGRRGRKASPVPNGAPGHVLLPTTGRAPGPTSRSVPETASGTRLEYAEPLGGGARASRGIQASPGPAPLSVEVKALLVESKLLLRDIQSQSQILYVLIVVLAMRLGPGRGGTPAEDRAFALIPFFFLALSGTYASWSLKNMFQTVRLLRQVPCDPARVMRGKAFFYGIIQSVCIAFLVVVLKLFGRIALDDFPAIWVIWLALSFATSATTVAAAAHKPEIPQATGVPRLDLGAGLAVTFANVAVAVVSGLLYMSGLAHSRYHSPALVWPYAAVAVIVNAGVFVYATNMAGNMTRGTPPGEIPRTGGSTTAPMPEPEKRSSRSS